MIYRVFTAQDTYVTDFSSQDILALTTPVTGANVGASEILQVFKVAPISGAVGYQATASLARSLVQFDLTQYGLLTQSLQIPSTGVTWHLMLKNARHKGTLPMSFAMEVCAVTQSWSAGDGLDTVLYTDQGVANWVFAEQNVPWDGGNGPLGISPQPFFFNTGHEDLDVDVTTIVNQWLGGTLTNNGLLVRLSSTLETDNNTYFTEIFHSSDTFYDDWRPYLEARWDDSVKDDRNNMVFGYSGTLFLYNRVRGQFTNLPGSPNNLYLLVTDVSGNFVTTATGSWTGLPGIYSASVTVISSSLFSGSAFYDVWGASLQTSGSTYFLSGTVYMTGCFTPVDSTSQPVAYPLTYEVNIPNLQRQYRPYENVRMNVFAKSTDYDPPVVMLTQSSDDSINGLVFYMGYWQIENDRTDEVIIPFGTGSVETTRLSYDLRGNWFRVYMSALSPGNVYRIVFLVDVDGESRVIDQGFKFRLGYDTDGVTT
ncbi:MAG: hypothetical protein ACYDHY_07480 [Acidiferrobacterales bacterium]